MNTKFKLGMLFFSGFLLIQNTYALDAAGEGRRAWLKYNCYSCHGMYAGGGMAKSIAGQGDDVSEVVLSGHENGMPSYNGTAITATEISNLATYLNGVRSNPYTGGAQNQTGYPRFMRWWQATPSDLPNYP